jgi:extracellular elastinolytic metalloproteinase
MKIVYRPYVRFSMFFFLVFLIQAVQAQDFPSKTTLAKQILQADQSKQRPADEDLVEMRVSSESFSEASGVTHIYFQQHIGGIPVFNAILNIHLTKDDKLLTYTSRFEPEARRLAGPAAPMLNQQQAVAAAAAHFNYSWDGLLQLKASAGGLVRSVVYENASLSLEDIPVQLVWMPMEDGSVRLCWDLSIAEPGAQHWWSVRVDAITGAILDKYNMVLHCDFLHLEDDCPHNSVKKDQAYMASLTGASGSVRRVVHRTNQGGLDDCDAETGALFSPLMSGGVYRVFPQPLESPIHGPRQLVNNPADPIASPLGWHNTGTTQYTRTRGNNTHAYVDADGNNVADPGSDPDGGAGLVFDFPLDLSASPDTYRPAAVANLFYWNNYMHDYAYKYGFREINGNFQVNNFGLGGAQNDDVRAEAQDGSGTNNANFSTPTDGSRPRMQMFIWNQGVSSVQVTSPSSLMFNNVGNAGFGPLNFNISGTLELADDGIEPGIDACTPLVGFTAGKIAVIDRGTCPFIDKVLVAQQAGAIAAIICNNAPGDPITMGGSGAVTIPSLMLSLNDCITLKALMSSGTVMVTMDRVLATYDSDFDNGVIAHEYAHGISNRLTGGRTNVTCLNNNEQMGEGWSDYFALMTTFVPGSDGADVRGVGAYLLGQTTTGNGIRPTPYSTDMAINPATYETIKSVSVPHGVGYVWCTMLWDMTWALIDAHGMGAGYDMAMNLVMEGMKLQPCRPGFVNGRDAILAADNALYAGVNNCIIWNVFARRGLGFSASQGSNTSVTDGIEAFDLPPGQIPTAVCANTSVVFNGESSITLDASLFVTPTTPCGNGSITLSPAEISCQQLGQTVLVNAFVTDAVGTGTMCSSQVTVSGLPCGWRVGPVAAGCGGTATFAPQNSLWTATATNCYYGAPFTGDAKLFAQYSLCGNGSLTARVASVNNANTWAGIVIRDSAAAGAKKVQIMTNMSSSNLRREIRTTTGGDAFPSMMINPNRYWLRLVRQGNTITGFTSANGLLWFHVLSVNIPMGACAEIGLVVTSAGPGQTGVATFDNVLVGQSGGPLLIGNDQAMQESMAAIEFAAFPNPTSGELNLDLSPYVGRNIQIAVFSPFGTLLYQSSVADVQSGIYPVSLADYPSGMYMVRVKADSLPDVTRRVLLQHQR